MAEKNGYHPNYPSANYPVPMPMPRNNQNMTDNNDQAVVLRGQEEYYTHYIVTTEQHQQRMNREISDLGYGRGGGQA